MADEPNPFDALSRPDLDAYLQGRFDKMTDAGREIAGVTTAPMPSIPMPGLMGATPDRPLQPPSGGFVTPEQIGTFAAEHGPILAGQALGATAGGMFGPMAPVAVPFLSGLGAMGGKYASNAILGRGVPSPAEQANEFKAGVLTEAGGQFATRALPSMLRTVMGAPSARTSAATDEAVRLSEQYRVPLSGGQATGSAGLQALEQVPSRYPIGAQRVVQFGETQRAASAEAVARLRQSVGRSETVATGEAVGKGLDAAQRAAKVEMDRLYEAATASAGGVTIPGEARIKAATAYLAKEGMVAPGLQSSGGLRGAKAAQISRGASPAEVASAARDANAVTKRLSKESPAALAELEAEIKANPNAFREALKAQLPDAEKELGDILTRLAEPRPMTYAQTRDLYLRMGDLVEKVGPETYQGKRLIQIKSAINQDIRAAAQAQGGEFAAKLDAANKYAAETYFPAFGDEAFAPKLREAAKTEPEKVVQKLLISDVSGIGQIKRILSQNSPQWKEVQSQVLQDLATRANADLMEVSGEVGQRFSVKKWLTLTEGPTSPYGPERLKAILEPAQYATLQELNRLFRVIEKGGSTFYGANPSGTAGGLLSAAQLAAVVGGAAYTGKSIAEGDLGDAGTGLMGVAASAAGPAVLARVLLSKTGKDLIAKGTLATQGTVAKLLRLSGAATRTGARLGTDPLADAMGGVSVPPMTPTP